MLHKHPALTLGLLVLFIASAVSSQGPVPPAGQPQAPELRKLSGDDARRAEELDKAITAALKADRCDEAIARAEELLALCERVQGPKHFETLNARWRLTTLRRLAPMSRDDRVAYQSADPMTKQAQALNAQGKYAQAQPLYEKALETRRRLLTDDHTNTATSYNNLANNLDNQGKHAAAQPIYWADVRGLPLRCPRPRPCARRKSGCASAPRGGAGLYRGSLMGRRPRQSRQGPPAGRARRRCHCGWRKRPAVRVAALLGRICIGG